MDAIKSLDRLIETLMQSEASDYVKVAKNMFIPLSDFKPYAYWKGHGYARNCIVKTKAFELILLCWNKNDFTPIHGHNNQHCWVYQVDGEITEVRYEQNHEGHLVECNRMQLTPGTLSYMNDNMGYHSLTNKSKPAMTLHLYMKPIDFCEVYNEEKVCFEQKELCFDTVVGKTTINS